VVPFWLGIHVKLIRLN